MVQKPTGGKKVRDCVRFKIAVWKREHKKSATREGGDTEIYSPLLARVACLAGDIFYATIFLVIKKKMLEGFREAEEAA